MTARTWENRPMPHARNELGVKVLTACAAYVALDWLSYIHPLQQSSITPWNPHPAVAIGLLALWGQRWIGAVFVAVLAAEVVVRKFSIGWPASLLVSAVLTLGYAAMAAAMANLVAVRSPLTTRSELGRLIAVVTLGCFVTGVLYVAALWATGATLPGPYFEALLQFWVGDCVGIIVTLPVMLMLVDPERRAELRDLARSSLPWVQVGSTACALWLVFGPAFGQPFKFFYLLFLPLVWIAVTQGLLGASLATLAIQVGVILAVQSVDYPSLTVFELQALLIALAVTGLVLGVVVDERRRTADRLRESLRLAAAGEMSAALAHELNQPLTALANYARAGTLIAAADPLDAPQLRAVLEKVLLEANRTAEVVRRLRDFFRTGATNLHPASIPDLASAVVEALRTRAEGSGVVLQQEATSGLPPVLVDSLQIEVVLRNLVANGLEAAALGAEPRWVRVEIATDEAGQLRTVVRDSGGGVTPGNGERIFQPFWSSRATGLGMGLAISRAIVEAHGGRLWVETRGEGVFGFTLPAAHA
jgi:two-component system, LuxR family, sensor kinase FixL